ncbi:hypothetical protein J2Y69_002133 [Microbacterium resistens]|uniref:HK97 gp10 family phage protein n=1 Tax=Microbacterium resistens TaxID=156977 RepID=A0ABU1SD80_9MICO|nr:hypothetical protein [Microbacterium resistens]MDR6867529.1 hypothetical protein [Microbacterium resistens]
MGVRAVVTMKNNFGAITPEIERRLVDGENKAAERLLALSVERAPLDIGTLIGSGTIERATNAEEGAAVVFDTPYAARLHEHPEYNFQGGRQGKYVEDPAVENKGELGDIIRKEVRGG